MRFITIVRVSPLTNQDLYNDLKVDPSEKTTFVYLLKRKKNSWDYGLLIDVVNELSNDKFYNNGKITFNS